MKITHQNIRLVTFSMATSAFLHIAMLSVLTWFTPHNYSVPVTFDSLVSVDLKSSAFTTLPEQKETITRPPISKLQGKTSYKAVNTNPATQVAEKSVSEPDVASSNKNSQPVATADPPVPADEPGRVGDDPLPQAAPPRPDHKVAVIVVDPPLRTAGEFLSSDSEKIRYRISLLGVPVGSAELEAKKENNQVRISLRVSSNSVIASIYPVDDLIETRHIGGNFILSTIRQQEGSFKSDRGFTIFLRDKNVFWIDRLTNRSVQESIPNSDVVDLLSGFYYLRNRPLRVGRTETLQIYDSDRYTELPVDILRREKIILPGFRPVDTLVIQPKLKTEGIFRRTGDVLIWLTDDQNHVPVKFVTSIALGQVTAELVSSDVQRPRSAEPGK